MTGAASAAVTFSVRPREGESDHSNFPRGKKGEEGSLLYLVCASGYFATRGLRKEGRAAAPPPPILLSCAHAAQQAPTAREERGGGGREHIIIIISIFDPFDSTTLSYHLPSPPHLLPV